MSHGLVFSPNFKAGYDITKKINEGLEYYGDLGLVGNFDALREQQQQIVPYVDLNLSPQWEFNFGVGGGLHPWNRSFTGEDDPGPAVWQDRKEQELARGHSCHRRRKKGAREGCPH